MSNRWWLIKGKKKNVKIYATRKETKGYHTQNMSPSVLSIEEKFRIQHPCTSRCRCRLLLLIHTWPLGSKTGPTLETIRRITSRTHVRYRPSFLIFFLSINHSIYYLTRSLINLREKRENPVCLSESIGGTYLRYTDTEQLPYTRLQ